MARMACISIPVLPLQILMQQHPDWREYPAAVVSEDKPLGRITHINKLAYADGIRPGMRYATALTLQPLLRAGTVEALDRTQLENTVEATCGRFSPAYERCSFASGVYWIDATGIEQLFESEYAWVRALVTALNEAGYSVRCVVGSSRRATFCTARSSRGISIFRSEEEEISAMRGCRLETLPFDEMALLRMRHLAIENIGEFLDLSGADIRSRFGESAFALHLFLSNPDTVPLQPEEQENQYRSRRKFQQGVVGFEALLAVIEPSFKALVTDARRHGVYFNCFELILFDEDHRKHSEEIQPAEPTRELTVFLRLFRIRLEAVRLDTPVYEFVLLCDAVKREATQNYLIGRAISRDRRKAEEAFSLIRAENGNDAVQISLLKSSHDPHKRFEWKETYLFPNGSNRKSVQVLPDDLGDSPDSANIGIMTSGDGTTPALCRRFYSTPRALPPAEFETVAGPYILGGNWWQSEKRREYRYLRNSNREIYWSFYSEALDSEEIYGLIG